MKMNLMKMAFVILLIAAIGGGIADDSGAVVGVMPHTVTDMADEDTIFIIPNMENTQSDNNEIPKPMGYLNARQRRNSRQHKSRVIKRLSRWWSKTPKAMWATLTDTQRDSVVKRWRRQEFAAEIASPFALAGLIPLLQMDLALTLGLIAVLGMVYLIPKVAVQGEWSRIMHRTTENGDWGELVNHKALKDAMKNVKKAEAVLTDAEAALAGQASEEDVPVGGLEAFLDERDVLREAIEVAKATLEAAVLIADDALGEAGKITLVQHLDEISGADLFNHDPTTLTFSIELELKVPNLNRSVGLTQMVEHLKAHYHEQVRLNNGILRSRGIGMTGDGNSASYTDPANFAVCSDGSLGSQAADNMSYSQDGSQGTCMGFEIKTPVLEIRYFGAIREFLDILKCWRYPGITQDLADGRPFVDEQCGMHVHIGPMAGRWRDARTVGKTLYQSFGRRQNGDEAAILAALVASMESNWGMMHKMIPPHRSSRIDEGSHDYARLKNGTMIDRAASARRLLKRYNAFSQTHGINPTHNTAEERREVWGNALKLHRDAGGDAPQTYEAFKGWDGEDAVPERLLQIREKQTELLCKFVYNVMNADKDGYPFVRLGSLLSTGTIEFRGQAGCLHADKIEAWVTYLALATQMSMSGMEWFVEDSSTKNLAEVIMGSSFGEITSTQDLFRYTLTDAIPPGHRASVGGNPLQWSGAHEGADFKAVAVLGLIPLLLKGLPLLLLLGVLLIVGCGIGGLIKMDDNKCLSKGEMNGVNRLLGELSTRGEEACGMMAVWPDGRVNARKFARPASENKKQSSYFGVSGYGNSYYSDSGSNIPLVMGPIVPELLVAEHGVGKHHPRDRRAHTYAAIIGHTRFGTGGANNERNAHPIKIGSCAGVHNGVLGTGWRKIRDAILHDPKTTKDSLRDMDNREVDSALIWLVLNELGGSHNKQVREMDKTLANSSMRLAWVDTRDNVLGVPRVHLWANTSDLYIAQTVKGNVVFASTAAILRDCWGPVLVKGTIASAKLGDHYVIDYTHGLINLGQAWVKPKKAHNANAWKKNTQHKAKKVRGNPPKKVVGGASASSTPKAGVVKVIKPDGRVHFTTESGMAEQISPNDPCWREDCKHCENGKALSRTVTYCATCKRAVKYDPLLLPKQKAVSLKKKCNEPECEGKEQPHSWDGGKGLGGDWDCDGPCSQRKLRAYLAKSVPKEVPPPPVKDCGPKDCVVEVEQWNENEPIDSAHHALEDWANTLLDRQVQGVAFNLLHRSADDATIGDFVRDMTAEGDLADDERADLCSMVAESATD